MKIKKVSIYEEPLYPCREIAFSDRELLNSKPSKWTRRIVIASVFVFIAGMVVPSLLEAPEFILVYPNQKNNFSLPGLSFNRIVRQINLHADNEYIVPDKIFEITDKYEDFITTDENIWKPDGQLAEFHIKGFLDYLKAEQMI